MKNNNINNNNKEAKFQPLFFGAQNFRPALWTKKRGQEKRQ
jgi:hypothetical protein